MNDKLKDHGISKIEGFFIHCINPFEWALKRLGGKPESLRTIYQGHEERYKTLLAKIHQYNGSPPSQLRDNILSDTKLCTLIRYYTACTRIRLEKINASKQL